MSDRLKSAKKKKELAPTGIDEIDVLAALSECTIHDYVTGVSAYVRRGSNLNPSRKKAAQIRLSKALARSLADELATRIPQVKNRLITDERKVAGGLRTVNADVSESHELDGLRLAVELKPINLAVGRAIWNRFGDIRTFAVNIHLKFPFAVVGGVLVIPTYEETGTKAARKAEQLEEVVAEDKASLFDLEEDLASAVEHDNETQSVQPRRKSTTHLIDKAIARLIRAGGRKSEADAAHLLEGIAVIVYDPETGTIDQNLPKPESGLRWEDCISDLAIAYQSRFED